MLTKHLNSFDGASGTSSQEAHFKQLPIETICARFRTESHVKQPAVDILPMVWNKNCDLWLQSKCDWCHSLFRSPDWKHVSVSTCSRTSARVKTYPESWTGSLRLDTTRHVHSRPFLTSSTLAGLQRNNSESKLPAETYHLFALNKFGLTSNTRRNSCTSCNRKQNTADKKIPPFKLQGAPTREFSINRPSVCTAQEHAQNYELHLKTKLQNIPFRLQASNNQFSSMPHAL